MDVRVGDKLIMKKNHPCGSHGSARQGGEEHKTYRARREGLAYFASRRFGGQE